jgi:hypothetical protein
MSNRLELREVLGRKSLTDRSGTIATGGTSQLVAPDNSSVGERTYLLFQNVSDTDMWINSGGVATAGAGSIKIVAGSGFTWDAGFVPTGILHVLCATGGKAFTCKEGI